MLNPRLLKYAILSVIFTQTLVSCMFMSQTGPQKRDIDHKNPSFELINVSSQDDLPSFGRRYGTADIPPMVKGNSYSDKVRVRDSLRFVISDLSEQSPFKSGAGGYAIGPLEVPQDGTISIPYIGTVQTLDRELSEIAEELNRRAKPISNTAQIVVGRAGRVPNTANVIGEVRNPGPVSLERNGMTSHDLLAASGGPTQSEHLFGYTLRRNGSDYQFDYKGFRTKPFPVEEGDLLIVTTDHSNRFYVMGAINRPTTVPFPVPSPTLTDAIAAASGLDERRSDPSGVFVFRSGSPDTVYTFNLKEPGVIFLTQRFLIEGEDLVYITEAPLARWNRLVTQLLPLSQSIFNLERATRN